MLKVGSNVEEAPDDWIDSDTWFVGRSAPVTPVGSPKHQAGNNNFFSNPKPVMFNPKQSLNPFKNTSADNESQLFCGGWSLGSFTAGSFVGLCNIRSATNSKETTPYGSFENFLAPASASKPIPIPARTLPKSAQYRKNF